jgi:hypothetical protein
VVVGAVTVTANAAVSGARGDTPKRAVDGHQASIDRYRLRLRPTRPGTFPPLQL